MRVVIDSRCMEQELVCWAEFWQACMDVGTDMLYMATLHEILEA